MARFELKLPKMGESVAEATITSWLKEIGETIDMDDAIVEVATDKVDTEVPSEVEGKLIEILFDKDEVVKVGQTIAIIETDRDEITVSEPKSTVSEAALEIEKTISTVKETVNSPLITTSSSRFYTPLVKKIAQTEGISVEELDTVKGTGKGDRVTKTDILSYIEGKNNKIEEKIKAPQTVVKKVEDVVVKEEVKNKKASNSISFSGEDEIIEMSRDRKSVV